MRVIPFTADIFMGLLVGAIVYAATTAILPGVGGAVALTIVLIGSVALVATRSPGGSLRRPEDDVQPHGGWSVDRVLTSDVTRWTVPGFVLKLAVAWLVSGVILAIAIPLLHAQGIEADQWIVWPVILGTMALCLGPDVWRLLRGRRVEHRG